MLPPGHIAAGYLLVDTYEKIFKPVLSAKQKNVLPWLGAFFGFVPDLDMFVAFFHNKSFTIQEEKSEHREYYTHYPILWLIASLITMIFSSISKNVFGFTVGIAILLGTWSHFLLDSIDSSVGIKWFWPFKNSYYVLIQSKPKSRKKAGKFFKFWFEFLRWYIKDGGWTSKIELILLIILIFSIFLK